MNKADVISLISEKLSIRKSEAEKYVETSFDEMFNVVKTDGSFRIGSYGLLSLVERNERNARNPQTGESIVVPAHKTIKFKVSPAYKKQVNEE